MPFIKHIIRILYFFQLIVFVFVVFFGLTLLLNTDFYVQKYAQFLVANPSPQDSDVIAVLSGYENSKRINEGIRLKQEGFGKGMIFSGYRTYENIQSIVDGVELDEDNIWIDEAESTYENAVIVKEVMDKNGFDSVIVVTSPEQSRRALLVFNYVMPEYNVSISYSESHTYDPEALFDDKQVRERFANEGIKYMYYLLKYGF